VSFSKKINPKRENPYSKAEILAGNCGFNTQVEANMDGNHCNLNITSQCASIQRMATELIQVIPYQEISFRWGMPLIHDMGVKYCSHAGCPVPVGIIKVVEIEAGLTLPTDVIIR
jgi:hypothetical protein